MSKQKHETIKDQIDKCEKAREEIYRLGDEDLISEFDSVISDAWIACDCYSSDWPSEIDRLPF